MRLIIEARLEGVQTDATAAAATIVDVVERKSPSVGDLGLGVTVPLEEFHTLGI